MIDRSQSYSKVTGQYSGVASDTIAFLSQNIHLKNPALWAKFVDQYRIQSDGDNAGWKGEFWGKMMRGAVLVYQYSRDEELFSILTETVRDMITVASFDRVSSYSADTEFTGWDMWCRKYALLGLEYYLEICRDEALRNDIIKFLCVCADYIIDHVGDDNGKIKITDTSNRWFAINSSSILESIVRLYVATDNKKYLDFAEYIINEGGAKNINVVELAFENKLCPYQYGVPKAYELMSFFEGLYEYALITGNEKYKTAVVNFCHGIMESDVTVLGTCGVTHELLDHSSARQTSTFDGVSQETCVTVTWMKLCERLLRETGESIYAEYIEKAFYNAYLAALNTSNCISDYAYQKFILKEKRERIVDTILPFGGYAPLIPGKRGVKLGGSQIFSDYSYYGCCASIGAAGIGVFLKSAVIKSDDNKTVYINFLLNGATTVSLGGTELIIRTETEYPVNAKTKISIVSNGQPVNATIKLRIPTFAENVQISSECDLNVDGGYAAFENEWEGESTIELDFSMPMKAHFPVKWEKDTIYFADPYDPAIFPLDVYQEEKDSDYIAITKGPLTLGADSRLGKSADSVFDFAFDSNKLIYEKVESRELDCMVMYSFKDKNGNDIRLVDYASTGKDWKSTVAAWMKTK